LWEKKIKVWRSWESNPVPLAIESCEANAKRALYQMSYTPLWLLSDAARDGDSKRHIYYLKHHDKSDYSEKHRDMHGERVLRVSFLEISSCPQK
jgi:hypothetical protein